MSLHPSCSQISCSVCRRTFDCIQILQRHHESHNRAEEEDASALLRQQHTLVALSNQLNYKCASDHNPSLLNLFPGSGWAGPGSIVATVDSSARLEFPTIRFESPQTGDRKPKEVASAVDDTRLLIDQLDYPVPKVIDLVESDEENGRSELKLSL